MVTVNGDPVEFRQGMVLAEALAQAGINTEAAMLLTVDNVYADKNDAVRIAISDNAEIRVMPILSGG